MLDILIITLTLLAGIFGFYKGFIWELFKYAALGIGLCAAYYGYRIIAQYSNNPYILLLTAFLSFIIVTTIALKIIHKLGKTINGSSLGTLNQVLGFALGGIKMFVTSCLMHASLLILTDANNVPTLGASRYFNAPLDYAHIQLLRAIAKRPVLSKLIGTRSTQSRHI